MALETKCDYIQYKSTRLFSSLVIDYLAKAESVNEFISFQPDLTGIKKAIEARKNFNTNREKISEVFYKNYTQENPSKKQTENIGSLKLENTFTICTAHQPNIFTGFLYFIYKTAHIIALSNELKQKLPEYNFVPVFYIGSEDNDFEELSKFNLNGKSFRWETNQSGAVGRMVIDKSISLLIEQIQSELGHFPKITELTNLLKKTYTQGSTMSEGIFRLLNELFKEEGLLVLQPDDNILKESFKHVMKDDLLNHTAEITVGETIHRLTRNYRTQVNPRKINLFYLRDGIRNRIDKRGNQYVIDDTIIRLSEDEILNELENNPSYFSPNVILRGLYQETILPNIIFVGGGSEIAYWLELKDLFTHHHIPYPVLILRNSFIIMDKHHAHKMKELNITYEDLFKEEVTLSNEMIQKWNKQEITLAEEEHESRKLFDNLKEKAGSIDKTLVQHIHALETFHLKKLEGIEKKMLKAERKKHAIELQRIWKLKSELFPNNTLQERIENFMPFFAKYGIDFIKTILQHSNGLTQEFGIITIDSSNK